MDTQRHLLPRGTTQGTSTLTRIGHYQLITQLAVGARSELFLARQGEIPGFRTPLVIKKSLPDLASEPDLMDVFLEEAQIAARLDHPNIVRVFEVGRAGADYFLAMELVQGKPLSSIMRRALDRRDVFNPRLAGVIVANAAAGLHHAHGLCDADNRPLGLVHGTLSPQKLLISFEGMVKVIDFGGARLARAYAETGSGLGSSNAYMAPEQARGDDVDHRADIFALGVILWEAICGRRLFARGNDLETARAILTQPIPRPSTIIDTHPALESVVVKALARDPAQRFGSAHEMALALERYVSLSGGAGTRDLSALMKTYFGENQVKWRNTVRSALEMEDGSSTSAFQDIKLSHTGVQPLPPSTTPSFIQALQAPLRKSKRQLLAAVSVAVVVLVVGILLVLPRRERAAQQTSAGRGPAPSAVKVMPLPASPERQPAGARPPTPPPAPRPPTRGNRKPSSARFQEPAERWASHELRLANSVARNDDGRQRR